MPGGRNLLELGSKYSRFKLDKGFYDKLLAAKSSFKLVEKFTIAPNNGRGFVVQKGCTFRVVEVEGPQIADVAFWSAGEPKLEFFSPCRTLHLEGMFMRPYSRLWSEVPRFRPIATCIGDTVETLQAEEGWHHHFLGGHCTPEMWEMTANRTDLNACHLNLLQAIESFGLKEEDLRDNINVHQKARVDGATGIMHYAGIDAKKGDYIEFYAEIDLLVAVSVCPSGDGARAPEEADRISLNPIGIEIYDSGIAPKEFPAWTDWRPTWQGKWMQSR